MTKHKGGASSETDAPVGASGIGDGEEGPVFSEELQAHVFIGGTVDYFPLEAIWGTDFNRDAGNLSTD